MKIKISCIVPAFNEADRISVVLDVLVEHELIDEVIVVNDGSTDNSEEILKKRKDIKLISYKKNRGKSHAVRLGMEAAKNEWIMTMDSDLVGLKKKHVTKLADPVMKGIADMTMALWQNSLFICKWAGFDIFSGLRVFNKSVIGDLDKLEKLPGFGLEVFLNEIAIKKKLRLCSVNFDNVTSTRKYLKWGMIEGIRSFCRMSGDIVKVMTFKGVIKQFFQILAIRKVV